MNASDLILHVEVRISEYMSSHEKSEFIAANAGSVWHHYASLWTRRNAAILARLGGPENPKYEKMISRPRGLPDDVSILTRMHAEQTKPTAYDHSWIGAEEISQLAKWWDETAVKEDLKWPEKDFEHGVLHSYLWGNSWQGFPSKPEDYPGIADVRFCYWFDRQ
jgi:hypothetical protein